MGSAFTVDIFGYDAQQGVPTITLLDVDDTPEPEFHAFGYEDEQANTMFAVFDAESGRLQWRTRPEEMQVEWLTMALDAGEFRVLYDGVERAIPLDDERVGRFELTRGRLRSVLRESGSSV